MDTIGNLLTSIRNAELASHDELTVPDAKQSLAVLDILKAEGYVHDVKPVEATSAEKRVRITLTQPLSRHHYRRLSKPGRRLYVAADRIPSVRSGFGFVIVSTSKGMMTGKKAKSAGLGGELICEVY